MKLLPISSKNIDLLSSFVEDMGSSSKTFRYFKTRDYRECIKNHRVTFLLLDDEPVAYGHLDVEDEKTWLGICVKEKFVGKGYGKIMMRYLVQSYDGDICLTVDSDNIAGIELYEKFSFKKISKFKKNMLYMELQRYRQIQT